MPERRRIQKPERAALQEFLDREHGSAAATILRLAWQAGLQRSEIGAITWTNVKLDQGVIQMSGRTIPLSEDLRSSLESLLNSRSGRRTSRRVVLSDRRRKPLTSYSISNLARTALQSAGVEGFTLMDLRTDYILQQIESSGLEYAARVTGMNTAWLTRLSEQYLPSDGRTRPVRAGRVGERPDIDRAALEELARRDGCTDGVLAVFLAMDAGAGLREIAELRWADVDLSAGTLILSGKAVRISPALAALLAKRRRSRTFVLTVPKTGRAYPPERISRLAREAMIRAGLDRMSLKDLNRAYARAEAVKKLTACIQRSGPVKRSQVSALLDLPDQAAGRVLRGLCEDGLLEPVGLKYYLPGTVVPTEEQRARILRLLERERSASCAAFAVALGTDVRQCGTFLHRMVQDGDIVRVGKRYQLPNKL